MVVWRRKMLQVNRNQFEFHRMSENEPIQPWWENVVHSTLTIIINAIHTQNYKDIRPKKSHRHPKDLIECAHELWIKHLKWTMHNTISTCKIYSKFERKWTNNRFQHRKRGIRASKYRIDRNQKVKKRHQHQTAICLLRTSRRLVSVLRVELCALRWLLWGYVHCWTTVWL